jgi:excisionase family DNA binding protein
MRISKQIPLATLAEVSKLNDTAELLTTQEVIDRLRISRRTLHEHVKRGKLPAIKLGARVLYHWPSVLSALLRNQREAS